MKGRRKRQPELASRTYVTRRTKVRRCACPFCNGSGTIPSTREIQEALGLTPRQAQLVEARLHGKKIAQICDEFALGRGTVKTSLARIYRKLEVSTLQELAAVVYEAIEAFSKGV